MKKKSIVNICHYGTKYLILLFPLIILVLSLIFDGYNGGMFAELSSFMDTLYNLPINSFYVATIDALGLSTLALNTYLGYVVYMPLWILWVYMLDLMLDFMLFIPKIAHKWLSKGYGED